MSSQFQFAATLAQVATAAEAKQLTPSAAANLRLWLTEPRYAQYSPQVADLVAAGKWKELDDAFWTVIPFGTGGRRGRMYPVGCNVINDRTIGESAQGLADYVKEVQTSPTLNFEPGTLNLSCALAYDTRHNSRCFAELCAEVMVANGFRVYFLDGYRTTPELSFLVRYKECACGIMVTASHNPPSDNAVKVYWSSGAQVIPPHDQAIVERVMRVENIQRTDFAAAVQAGQVIFCQDEVDPAFLQNVVQQGFPGPRDLKIIYSPLHGVGESAVCPVLAADGFAEVEVFAPHREPSGDFPNVPGNVSNPENAAVFDAIIERAKVTQADLILATDPDCDRMGCAAPRGKDRSGAWGTFTGNQLCALVADYVCQQRKKAGTLSKEHFLVTTLVTTPLVRRIGDSYGVQTRDNVHVGFKWIAEQIDLGGPDKFLLGTEESYGFLIGQYVRDKDGPAACLLMAELAAAVKAKGQTLFDKLDSLYWQHGYHGERQINVFMTGSAGMTRMQQLMHQLRTAPPASLGGMKIRAVRDYQALTTTPLGGTAAPLAAPPANMVILDLAEPGHHVAVRPSGTEPKVKFYLFTHIPAEQLHLLEIARDEMNERLDQWERELKAYADGV
ncbi:MAG: phospho-sugar mutase [Pirellulaceae bacterium]|nr:phospho-sugar mutase [Pirellulaceae bacterium]